MILFKKTYIIHPYLFALFPVLSVFSTNIGQTNIVYLCVPVFALTVFVWIAHRTGRWFLKNDHISAILVSFLIIFIFSYDLFSHALLRLNIDGFIFKRHMYRMALYVPLSALVAYVIIKLNSKFNEMTKVLNLISILLVSLCIMQMGYFSFKLSDEHSTVASDSVPDIKNNITTPDIYYIILDGYAREDVLKEVFSYDNSDFTHILREKGFFIPKQARSNYAITNLSIPSSTNLNYLHSGNQYTESENDAKIFLENRGYKYYHISSTIWENGKGPLLDLNNFFANEFTLLILRKTVVDSIAPRFNLYAYFLRQAILYDFEKLNSMPSIPGKKFVLAHIMAPHPPYIFGPNGEYTMIVPLDISMNIFKTPWDNKNGYVNQLRFVNKKIKETLEIIIKESKQPPIIILQADHGPHLSVDKDNEARISMRILNAYHLPNGGNQVLYDTITPINTFRVIFNYYFDYGIPLLADKCYYSAFSSPYMYSDLTDFVSSDITLNESEK